MARAGRPLRAGIALRALRAGIALRPLQSLWAGLVPVERGLALLASLALGLVDDAERAVQVRVAAVDHAARPGDGRVRDTADGEQSKRDERDDREAAPKLTGHVGSLLRCVTTCRRPKLSRATYPRKTGTPYGIGVFTLGNTWAPSPGPTCVSPELQALTGR